MESNNSGKRKAVKVDNSPTNKIARYATPVIPSFLDNLRVGDWKSKMFLHVLSPLDLYRICMVSKKTKKICENDPILLAKLQQRLKPVRLFTNGSISFKQMTAEVLKLRVKTELANNDELKQTFDEWFLNRPYKLFGQNTHQHTMMLRFNEDLPQDYLTFNMIIQMIPNLKNQQFTLDVFKVDINPETIGDLKEADAIETMDRIWNPRRSRLSKFDWMDPFSDSSDSDSEEDSDDDDEDDEDITVDNETIAHAVIEVLLRNSNFPIQEWMDADELDKLKQYIS